MLGAGGTYLVAVSSGRGVTARGDGASRLECRPVVVP
jgi:hypothetical protein